MLGLVYATSSALAKDNANLSEQDFLFDLPPILSASRLAQPLERTPAAITVIDREQLESLGTRNLPDVLRLVPGMVVGSLDGNQIAASYHGLGDQHARRMQVLIDGRPVYSPMLGGVDWVDLPISIQDIDRIEVVRGPGAATYGANAFLGVISILTRHTAETLGWSASTTAGQYQRQRFRFGGQAGEALYRFTAERNVDHGFARIRDSRQYHYFSGRADIRVGELDSVSLNMGVAQGHREAGQEGEVINTPHHGYHQSQFGQLRWLHPFADGSELSIQLYSQSRYDRQETTTVPLALDALPPQPYLIATNLDEETRTELEIQHSVSPHPSLRLAWGGSLRHERVRATGYISGPSSRVSNQLQRLFADATWQPNALWSVHTGLMMERDRLAGRSTAPRVAINYQPWARHTFRVSESHATRNPALFEQRGDFGIDVNQRRIRFILADGTLQAEKIRSRDIGYLWHWPDQRLNLDIRLFDDRIDHLVNLTKRGARSAPLYFRNEVGIRLRGSDIQLGWSPWQWADLRIGYTRASTRARSDSTPDELVESVPHYTFTGSASLRQGRWSGNLTYFRVGKMVWMWDGDRVGDLHRWDASLGYSMRLGRLDGKLMLSVQNLTNSHYMDFYKENFANRTTALTLSVDY
ncbi:iron complex outermembrane receptor protein [Chitinivorax tropicus]|uniref:Iron complex outermembrane receptor protein n=1 Tax=Chitinivorax tropicus TaxID=714531 RepID=A0A840MES5_9PROT|nr:TonB-dependent receptor [Chitinivorax tropicus]MBB5016890.1 iron complex outermembrane receptor protein [Chitinivorax tropicus]